MSEVSSKTSAPLEFFAWIRSVFSESTGPGAGSESRVSHYTSVVGTLLVVGFTVYAKVFIPTAKDIDVPPGAQVLLLALLGVSTGAYIGNKMTTYMTAKNDASSTATTSMPTEVNAMPVQLPPDTKDPSAG